MPLLIDGHNLIGQLPDIRLDDPHDEAKLVARLKAYVAHTGKRITVVFDHGMPGGHSDLSSGRIEVVFAASGHSADGILRERIRRSRNPGGLTVVTSDHEVIKAAKSRGAHVIRSEAFAGRLRAPHWTSTSVKENIHLSPEEVERWLEVFRVEEEQ